jgi:c(7)-type cytochrome triheme protein
LRPLVAAIGALCAAAGIAAAAPAGEAPAEGFDHIAHQGRVEARALAAPDCQRCHRIDRAGRLAGAPGHASCFGAGCHGKPPARPYAIDAGRRAVCVACHRPALIDGLARSGRGPLPAAFPPYPADGEFALSLSHAAHASVSGGCRACHPAPAEPEQPARRPAPGHARCAACHLRAPGGVAMSACARCHTPAVGPLRAPHAEASGFPVGRRFSHRKHAARGAGCTACHAGAAAATGEVVPTPRKPQCAGCHDGRRAFSMVEPACRRCHAAPEREEPAVARAERARFSHAAHAGSDCRACHQLDAGGAPGPIGRGHRPCADAGCHADDFAARAPVTCTVCHARAEPWRDLHIDPQPADTRELAVDFPHALHRAACAGCHPAQRSGRFGPVAGHAACAGSGCHAPSGGPRPPLGDCARCHRHSAGDPRPARARRWSVRAQFTHRQHLREPSDPQRPVPCADCHTTVAAATSLAALRPPAKATCARCHDGGAAFKLTGHACNRCHLVR